MGFALKMKGANVDFLTCNSSLGACTNAYNFAIIMKMTTTQKNFVIHVMIVVIHCSTLTSDLLQLSDYIQKSLDEIDNIVKKTENKNIPI